MKILVACEESQAVCKAFRAHGHEAYSADIQEPSGGHPEWHILGDVLPLIDGDCTFRTMDGQQHCIIGEWDMIIAFPPCTDLAASGARSFARKRADGTQERSKQFFLRFTTATCKRIAIENPVGIMSTCYRKPTQIVQPWYFGEDYQKTTCLWLIGLPKLIPTVTENRILGIMYGLTKRPENKSDKRSGIMIPGARANGAVRLHRKRRKALQTLWPNSGGVLA